jgi:hypothetical protein
LPTQEHEQYINIHIDQVKLLGSSGDTLGEGEFILFIFLHDNRGSPAKLICPGDKPVKVKFGSTFSPCSYVGLSAHEDGLSSDLYVSLLGYDQDESDINDVGAEVVASTLSHVLWKKIIPKIAGSAAGISNPFVIISADIVLGLTVGKTKDWIEQADYLGGQVIHLTRQDGWNAGSTNILPTENGKMEFTISISRSKNPEKVVLNAPASSDLRSNPSPEQASHSKIIVVTATSRASTYSSNTSCPGAPKQRLEVGRRGYVCTQYDRVIVRTEPRKRGDEITRLVPGTYFKVTDGPACANNWSWWKIRTDDGIKGWIAEGGDDVDPYFICPQGLDN